MCSTVVTCFGFYLVFISHLIICVLCTTMKSFMNEKEREMYIELTGI